VSPREGLDVDGRKNLLLLSVFYHRSLAAIPSVLLAAQLAVQPGETPDIVTSYVSVNWTQIITLANNLIMN
jgi:hypothetical protein